MPRARTAAPPLSLCGRPAGASGYLSPMEADRYGFSDDCSAGLRRSGNSSKVAWAVGFFLAAFVVWWWWAVYSNTDSDQSIGAHITVVLMFGIPSWLILFGAFLGARGAVRWIRHRSTVRELPASDRNLQA